jgi:hypothetical protein
LECDQITQYIEKCIVFPTGVRFRGVKTENFGVLPRIIPSNRNALHAGTPLPRPMQ